MSQEIVVYLSKYESKKGKKVYHYWRLQWMDSASKNRSKSIGAVAKLSQRQAEKIRKQHEFDFNVNPEQRDKLKAPTLKEFLERYYSIRTDIRPGTLELHRQTGRYLIGYFGENRRIDTIQKVDADVFRAALANGELKHVNKGRRQANLNITTVDMNMRNSRSMFEYA